MIELKFETVEEYQDFTTKLVKSNQDEMARLVENIGHFIQNISPEIGKSTHELGTYLVLNSEKILLSQHSATVWEEIHKEAREKLNP